MVSRYEPVITINAMVKVGRWTIGPVHYGPPRHCDRCNTWHKYVYVCTIDADVPDDIVREKLSNERVWWVGSTCGPTLGMVSDAQWAVSEEEWEGWAKDFKKAIKLAMRATQTIEQARAQGYDNDFMKLVVDDLELLMKNRLPARRRRVMASLLGFIEGWLQKKAEAAKAGAALPPTPWAHSSLRDRAR